jgi:hypothetical protein
MEPFPGKAPQWNKEKMFALIRLMTEKSTIKKRKFTPSICTTSGIIWPE